MSAEKEKEESDVFLHNLRASMPMVESNEDTLPFDNRNQPSQQPPYSSLSDLFQPPLPPPTSPKPSPQHTKPIVAPLPAVLPRPAPLHQRNVSWGVDPKASSVGTSASPLEQQQAPSLEETTSGGTRPLVEVVQIPASSLEEGKSRRHRRKDTKIMLEDLLRSDPFETEAETHIIKALEHRRLRSRADTMNSSIMSAADDALHDFRLDFEDSHSHLSDGGVEEKEQPLSPMNPPHSEGSLENTTNRERTKSVSSRPALRDDSESNVTSQSRPLLERGKSTRRMHRHTMSVEDTLSGLTLALHAVHQDGNETKSPETYKSSADAFAQNTVLLMDNGETTTKSPTTLPEIAEADHDVEDGSVLEDHASSSQFNVSTSSSSSHHQVMGSTVGPEDGTSGGFGGGGGEATTTVRRRKRKRRKTIVASTHLVRDELQHWNSFFRNRIKKAYKYSKTVLFYLIIPATLIAAILFYWGGNPPTGKSNMTSIKASASWWLLFMCVRQVITFSFALLTQALVIDFLALETRILLRLFGPVFTLLVVQSKGWPFLVMVWAIIDFGMLHGDTAFANHWLFWQAPIGLFNEQNTSGHIVDNHWNTNLLAVAIGVGAATAIKRFVIGLYLGRQTFAHHGKQLANVMKDMLLVSEVAGLAKQIEKRMSEVSDLHSAMVRWNEGQLRGLSYDDDDALSLPRSSRSIGTKKVVVDPDSRDPLTGSLDESDRFVISQMLEEWEEPDAERPEDGYVPISAVLNFRKALVFIQKRYPFSYAFGEASTREECIESSQNVYFRLLERTPESDVLHFETLALITVDEDSGKIDQDKARELMKLFRPDRQGNLTLIDFVRSVDSVYKAYRLLSASIANSSRIDQAFERIFNVVFYVVAAIVVLAALGFDPVAIFLSLSSIVLAFAFMIGRASANYFEGLLFILVRRPYNIGDRIHVSHVERDPDVKGSRGWVVENVTLFETTAFWTPTKEHCSLSNGSLANSRIINAARSPQGVFHILLKFPIDTPYDKIQIFKTAVEEYLKARPREWLCLTAFRATRIETEQSFIEYDLVVTHRESWQAIGVLLNSKGNLISYCREVTKQLNMHYRAPSQSVDLTVNGKAALLDTIREDLDVEKDDSDAGADQDTVAQRDRFRTLALRM